MVTDEVWPNLEPRSGSLPHRTRRRVVAALLAILLLAIALGAMHVKGVLNPQLAAWTSEFAVDTAHQSFEEKLTLSAGTWVDVQLRDVQVDDDSSYRLLSVKGVPGVVPNDRRVTITLDFRVTDCVHPPRAEPLLRFEIHQWWGTTSLAVQTPKSELDTPQGPELFMDGPAWLACGPQDS